MQKIMFKDRYGLTKAVLEGRKTMTRRVVPEKLLEAYYDYDDYVNAVAPRDIPCSREYEEEFFLRRSRFKVGEVVAVVQAYKDCVNEILVNWEHKTDIGTLVFKMSKGWNNKMFVRADLMIHQIRITNVRVERLQDISDEDSLREGISKSSAPGQYYVDGLQRPMHNDGVLRSFTSPRDAFAALIDRMSGKGTWASNPWVFVYEFELVK